MDDRNSVRSHPQIQCSFHLLRPNRNSLLHTAHKDRLRNVHDYRPTPLRRSRNPSIPRKPAVRLMAKQMDIYHKTLEDQI